jgi:2-dehydro-3-deoxyphosphogalactonate aldolase
VLDHVQRSHPGLTGELAPTAQPDYLSGLLIGHELVGACRVRPAQQRAPAIDHPHRQRATLRPLQPCPRRLRFRRVTLAEQATERGLWQLALAAGLLAPHPVKPDWRPDMLKQALAQNGLIAILRGLRPQEAAAIGEVLYAAGFRVIEVPLNSRRRTKASASCADLARRLPDRCRHGADPEQVEQVKAAGGQVIVMPTAMPRYCAPRKRRGCTCRRVSPRRPKPSRRWPKGADILKLFPAEQMGPAVVKAWLAVLPAGTMLAPVGGITPDNMQVFIDAGVKGSASVPGCSNRA